MDSKRPNRSYLLSPLHPTKSGKAAFSLANVLLSPKQNSDAGVIAGVFFGYRRSIAA
jgi:hypothetical protein